MEGEDEVGGGGCKDHVDIILGGWLQGRCVCRRGGEGQESGKK